MACFRAVSNCFLILAFLVLTAAQPAHAAVDAAGAEKLRGVVNDIVGKYRNAASSKGGQLVLDGDILIEPNGSYYAVTLPSLRFIGPTGKRTEIGMIAINAMPASTPGDWKMTVALPSPMSHFDDNDKLFALTTIGAQNFAGIWTEKMGAFTKLEASYKDIKILNPDHSPITSIANANINADFKDNGSGLWSGAVNMGADTINIGTAGGPTAKVGKITMTSVMKDYDLTRAMDYNNKIGALTESYESGEGEQMSMQHVLALYNLVTEFMVTGVAGFDVNMNVQDVELTRIKNSKHDAGTLTLQNGMFGFAMDGLRTDKAAMHLKSAYNNLVMNPVPPGVDTEAMPDHGIIDISINNLPLKQLLELGRNSLQMTAQAPNNNNAQMAMLSAVVMAPKILTDAQTNLAIHSTEIGNSAWGIVIDSLMTADMRAQLSATGTATVKITGMDVVMNNLRKKVKDPSMDPQKKARIEDTLKRLTVLQLASTKQKTSDGKQVDVFNFELGQNGQVMLNGTDLSSLMPKE